MSRGAGRATVSIALATVLAVVAGGWGLERALGWAQVVPAGAAAGPDGRPESYLSRGWRRLDQGRAGIAAEAFREALRLAPGHPEALRGLAHAEAARGHREEAVLALGLALATGALAPSTERRARATRFAWQQELLAGARSAGAAEASPGR